MPAHDLGDDVLPHANCDVREMARLVIGDGAEAGTQVSLRYAQDDLIVIWRGPLCSVATRSEWQRALIERLAASESSALQALLLSDVA